MTRFSLGTTLLVISLICLLLAMFRVLTIKLVILLGVTILGVSVVGVYGIVGGIAVLQLARILLDQVQRYIDQADELGSLEERKGDAV